uniref:SS18 N-terminal domain-containing protein n=1 Tax=Chromera velia CCMP2878 TaxID=1169474 RepID=A0A0G4FUN6_9ALVE|eukprot:Cvel_3753.t1-p1 / transcript=Cvel_3753.t1 / gene=Cvel_3753 / organism=Chromera_velia_CCMP2878 / gene_product=hypothetical protein / transcript_product=hypothetical protein / location=Cvel_scaffold156:124307-124710(+) / protein_length=105 / sequence_SO=supercontig / SO=protein_coding / is_pseudo=false
MDVEEDVQAAIDRLWKNGLPHPPEQLRGIHVANQASAQRLLDENQQLIFAVSENARIKRFADCAAYLERLQQNLLYLALLADQVRPLVVPHCPSLCRLLAVSSCD